MTDNEKGYNCAIEDVKSGDISDVQAAIESFRDDPADSEFQKGYLAALISIDLQKEP